MKVFTILFIMISMPLFLFGQASDLFFSEYMEGSSNNKYLEIYNGTGADIDLSAYEIWRANNGNTWDISEKNTLEGTIIAGDVWVICNSGANNDIQAKSDVIGTNITWYNGNDAIALVKGESFLDIIGVEGVDPGSAWDVAGVSGATGEHTLVRKSSVLQGNTDWTASAGTNADDSEWIVLDQDDFTNLGIHAFDGGSSDFPPVIAGLSATTKVPGANESVTVSATVTDDSSLVKVELVYTVNDGAEVVIVLSPSGDLYSGVIPASAYNNGDRLIYFLQAVDGKSQETKGSETKLFVGDVSIADVKQLDADGAIVFGGFYARLTGVLTVGSGTFSSSSLQVYLQDGSGAINIFMPGETSPMAKGNSYTVVGKTTQFNGLIEIEPDDFATDITDNGVGELPAPIELTIAQLLSSPEAFESFLIKIVAVDSVAGGDAWPDSTGNANIIITDDAGSNQITMRIDRDTDIDSTSAPAFPINVVGIFNQYDFASPYDAGYQILPRSLEDIKEVTAIGDKTAGIAPLQFKLYDAFPNPFNPVTTLVFDLPVKESKNSIELSIFNVLGQKIAVLAKGKFNSGQYTYKWNAAALPSGIYFAVLNAGSSQQISRLLLIK
jgi:Lamin Tail Domain/Secretion system C-terminal sorting domain